jgi:glycosyltransferase involved in cell wall biosynthesis
MRILYFHQYFTTRDGANGSRSYELARRLVARGHDVTLVCGSTDRSQTGLTGAPRHGVRRGNVDGMDVIEICVPYSNYDGLRKRALAFLRFACKSVAVAWRERYDLLFATSTPLTAGVPGIAMRLLKRRRKFVFEVRDLWPELPKAMGVITNPLVLAGLSLLEKACYTAMHAGVALSPGIEQGMRRRAGARKPIALVPNGCDLDMFAHGTGGESSAAAPPEGFPRDGLRCAFIGAHGIANGLDAVLDAARALARLGRSDIHLIFIGEGRLKPALVDRARKERLENCRFFDPLPKRQLAGVMGHIDVGLMTLANVPAFYCGTSPNKFFDYIASGLPVLNNYPGWLADLIRENRCGVVVSPGDPEEFARALVSLADDRTALVEMGRNARRLAERQFDRDRLAQHLIEFLESVAASEG